MLQVSGLSWYLVGGIAFVGNLILVLSTNAFAAYIIGLPYKSLLKGTYLVVTAVLVIFCILSFISIANMYATDPFYSEVPDSLFRSFIAKDLKYIMAFTSFLVLAVLAFPIILLISKPKENSAQK